VVDVSPYVKPNDTQATMVLESTKEDIVLLGVVATSIASTKPIIETILTYPPGVSTKPGDVIEFTSTSRNIGDAVGGDLIIEQKLPPGLSYVPETVRMYVGADTESQWSQDRQARRRSGRVGSADGYAAHSNRQGRDGHQGRNHRSDRSAGGREVSGANRRSRAGELPLQSTTTVTPVGGASSGPISFPSGNGVTPNAPTIVVVPPCVTNDDCSLGAPVCDKKGAEPRCTDVCDSDVDCQGTPGGSEICSAMKSVCSVARGRVRPVRRLVPAASASRPASAAATPTRTAGAVPAMW
jgi:uncharacterized repeat protein (TIGR01451 family)